jgi:trimethylamine:corrinoid methyltransferase-like protein
MRREHYVPPLSDRESREDWEAAGAKPAAERAHDVVEGILSQPSSLHIPEKTASTLLEKYSDISKDALGGAALS